MIAWVKAHLVEDVRNAHMFWTIQLAVVWGAFSGFMMVWPAMLAYVPIPWFLGLSMLFCVILGLARLFKQPGID